MLDILHTNVFLCRVWVKIELNYFPSTKHGRNKKICLNIKLQENKHNITKTWYFRTCSEHAHFAHISLLLSISRVSLSFLIVCLFVCPPSTITLSLTKWHLAPMYHALNYNKSCTCWKQTTQATSTPLYWPTATKGQPLPKYTVPTSNALYWPSIANY